MAVRLASSGRAPEPSGAAAWAARLDRGGLTEAEAEALERWLAEPGNRLAMARANAALHVFDGVDPDMPELAALRAEALADIAARAPSPARRWSLQRVAPWGGGAIAASVAALFLLIGQEKRAEDAASMANRSADAAAPVRNNGPGAVSAYRTDIGETRAITLSDGSRITLDTQSEVHVDYRTDARRVTLVRGQALFEVAHAQRRPFSVEASGHRVTALGTVFEVRLDRARLKVTLLRGSVRVDSTEPKTAGAPVSPPATLAPGQQFIANATAAPEIEQIDVARQALWRRSMIEFDRESIAQAASELNRYSRQQIIVKDPAVASLRISGIVRTGNPADFANLIGTMLPVAARPTATGDIELYAAEKQDDVRR